MTDLNIPDDAKELEDKSLVDLQLSLPETANPMLEESWMGAQAIANARRVFDFYTQLKILELEAIPVTAIEKLELWASYWGITKNPATQSSGNVVATGTAGSIIPQSTQLQSSDGNSYTTASDVTITDQTVQISSLTNAGGVATASLSSDASLFSGQTVTIFDSGDVAYNGTFLITVTGLSEFTYALVDTPAGASTGKVSFTSGSLSVKSVDFGQDQNLIANTRLTFSTPIVGVDQAAFVDFGAVGGGSDIETTEELRARLLDRVQNPVALFNAAAITAQAKTVSGVTDVFVFEITPDVGQVTIFPIRGNDASPIPDASEIPPIKDAILEIKPVTTSEADVIVSIATGVNASFTFSAMTPNDSETQERVDANLDALFRDEAVVASPSDGIDNSISEDQYSAAIVNAGVTEFTLSSPSGDIGSAFGDYAVYTGANFP